MKRACDTELRPATESIVHRYAGKTVVAIGAHPDDLEIGIGGTLAKLQKNGAHVVMCVASIPKDFDTRLAEAKRGAEILGCELKVLMDDGPKRLEDVKTCDLVGLLDGVVRDYKPAAVLTLVEMVVVIAVLGFLMTILVGITRAVVSQQRYATTRSRMANIDTALAVFVSINKRLPCPADGRTASAASGAGFESSTGSGSARTCNNSQQYGVIPWATLGLTATDAEDGWGSRFTYRVGPALVADGAMDFTACDPAGGSVAPASPPPFCSSTCSSASVSTTCTTPAFALAGSQTKGVYVTNVSGPSTGTLMDPRAAISTGAAYVFISHGPEGGGGYDGNGVLQSSTVSAGTAEAMNFANIAWANPPASGNPTVYLVDDVINSTATTAHFDDMVSRVGILALAMKAQTGPRTH